MNGPHGEATPDALSQRQICHSNKASPIISGIGHTRCDRAANILKTYANFFKCFFDMTSAAHPVYPLTHCVPSRQNKELKTMWRSMSQLQWILFALDEAV